MGGCCQRTHLHEILAFSEGSKKRAGGGKDVGREVGPFYGNRINITFRNHRVGTDKGHERDTGKGKGKGGARGGTQGGVVFNKDGLPFSFKGEG